MIRIITLLFFFLWNSSFSNEKIVTCSICGGLGNQLFQIAATLAFAWDHGYEPIFPNIDQSVSRVSPRPVYWDSMFHKVALYPSDTDLSRMTRYSEKLQFQPIEPLSNEMVLQGHYCCGKYFDHHREKILEIFQLPPEMQAYVEQRYRQIVSQENENTVSIHIRLDDTFTTPCGGVIDFWRKPYDSYYDQAIALFPGDVTFVVFSDNSDWSREYMKTKLKGRRVVYCCDKDYLDIHLMGLCKHNIIVNSTYSWWGAYFNRNPKKIVVSPKFWQKKENTPYRPALLMPEWTLISNIY